MSHDFDHGPLHKDLAGIHRMPPVDGVCGTAAIVERLKPSGTLYSKDPETWGDGVGRLLRAAGPSCTDQAS